jgi:hypothetical protein
MTKARIEVLNAVPAEVKVGMINSQIDTLCEMCYQFGADGESEFWTQEIKRVKGSIREMLTSLKKGVAECRTTSKVEAAS